LLIRSLFIWLIATLKTYLQLDLSVSHQHTLITMSAPEVLIKSRYSARAFLPDQQVPWSVIRHALEVARYAASNLNTQPWRLIIVSEDVRDRLSAKMQAAFDSDQPLQVGPLPEPFEKYQIEWGQGFLGETMKISRDDDNGRKEWFMNNFDFFKAPTAAIVAMHQDFHHEDSFGVGGFVQLFELVLLQEGVRTCSMVSIAGYGDILREELGIEKELRVICGVAIGYPDLNHPANRFRPKRENVDHFASFRNTN
jgi:nitroreductase